MVNLNKLRAIAWFVRDHGFFTAIDERAGLVWFELPYVTVNGATGHETVRVRTYAEARKALGY